MSYKGATPSPSISTSLSVSPRIVAFFENFYAISDNPSTHEEYAQALSADAELIMGTKRGQGHDEILALRKANWAGPIASRRHVLHKIFPFAADEVMLYGAVTYGLKNGNEVTVDWAARAVFEDVDTAAEGSLRMKFYQVYLDSAPVLEAAKG